jgi:hypothetical protein
MSPPQVLNQNKGVGRSTSGICTVLRALVEVVALSGKDTVVALGNHIDYGPDSNGVIRLLLRPVGRCTLVPLKGDHEEMFLAGPSVPGRRPLLAPARGDPAVLPMRPQAAGLGLATRSPPTYLPVSEATWWRSGKCWVGIERLLKTKGFWLNPLSWCLRAEVGHSAAG